MKNQGRHQTQKNFINMRPQMLFLVLSFFFLLPIFSMAFAPFKGHSLFGLLNYGEPVQSPFSMSLLNIKEERGVFMTRRSKHQPTNASSIKGKWMLVYFNPDLCEMNCQKGLAQLAYIQKAAGENNSHRIARALLTYPSNLANNISLHLVLRERYPGTQLFIANQQRFTHIIRKHISKSYALEAGTIYLIDPTGNVIMTYPADSKPTGILKDLQRLLKSSQ